MNATEKSDIDLFIITKKNRLFIARSFLTLLFHLLRLRRHGHKIAGRFCLSFFVSEDHLDFEKLQMKPEDPYLAFWMKSLKPLYNEHYFSIFYKSNHHWMKKYFPGFQIDTYEMINGNHEAFPLFHTLEKILRKAQLKRIFRKKETLQKSGGIMAHEGMLKFHNEDRREMFYGKWKEKLQNLSRQK